MRKTPKSSAPNILHCTKFNCSRAKLLLKKKRYQEQLLVRTDNQLETLEKMTQDLEFAQIEIKVILHFVIVMSRVIILVEKRPKRVSFSVYCYFRLSKD